jgi:hypothetical protein
LNEMPGLSRAEGWDEQIQAKVLATQRLIGENRSPNLLAKLLTHCCC